MSVKFKEYKQLNLISVADEVADFWKENHIFKKSMSSRSEDNTFVFFEGPPSANGLPGIHHVIGRTVKDIFARYKTMQGYRVNRKAGWDTHGLPVELSVEKELGITKEDIGKKISIDQYNAACKKSVMKYTDIWNNLTERIGYWVDMEDPYITYKSKYMESVWWLLKQIYNKGLLYKGYTIQPYSPKAGTGLSSHELNQPGCYRDVTDTTVVAQFKIKEEELTKLPFDYDPSVPVYFLAWTTTPWTLPSNTALTVGKKIEYVLVRTFNQYTFEPIQVVLAKPLLAAQFGKKFHQVNDQKDVLSYQQEDKTIPYFVVGTCTGKDLLEIKYEQLLPFAQPYQNPENAFRVIAGDFVTTEDGTGIVHTAPTFGQDDANVAKQAVPEVPPMLVLDKQDNPVPLVDLQGRFTAHMGPYASRYVKNEYYVDEEAPEKSVDIDIAIQLKTENKAFHVEKHVHNYPHCWRTDKPVLYYPLDSWFIKISEVKDRLFDLNQKINWKPKATGEGRFGNWLQNANDWNLSRSRFWGIPLPIWRTEDGTEEVIIGSVEELIKAIEVAVAKEVMDKNPYEGFETGNMSEANYDKVDLHKNVVDKIILVAPSGKPMYREADLIDVWFDSGAMPVAQWHYPFEEVPKAGGLTADFIAEGVDQTRGWFYTLHAIAGLVFDDIAYKNVLSNGLVLDKFGKKMSKRLGNAIDPFKTLDEYGPDAIRWYMIANANPWDNLKFDLDGVDEVRRKFFGTLYNTYSFFALYANLDKFTFSESEMPLKDRSELDRWILSELHTLVKKVNEALDDYEPTKAARDIQYFVNEHLSNWFVRLSRRRFWKGEYGADKIAAYQTLYTCLLTVAKLGAPMAPFFMERLYKDLIEVSGDNSSLSVHLDNFPKYDKSYIDKHLERKMEKAQLISSMTLSLRQLQKIKVRQPLQRIMIPIHNDEERKEIQAVSDLIQAEVNVKEIQLLDDASGVLVKQIKPNFKVLGPRFGADMKEISGKVAQMTQEDITNLETEGTHNLVLESKEITLELSDFEITTKDIEGWIVAHENGTTVALDITITDALKDEGIARELVNRIQNIRKGSGLEVTDRIEVFFNPRSESRIVLEKAVHNNYDYITNETLTDAITFKESIENGTEIAFDDIVTDIKILKSKESSH
jgi:isoleucyl-tRNA synthetase